MKKLINLFIIAMIAILPVFATEFEYQPVKKPEVKKEQISEQPYKNSKEEKLDKINKIISKYEKWLRELPEKIRKSKSRLNTYNIKGEEIDDTTRSYLAAIDICSNQIQTEKAKDLCIEVGELDLGRYLKKSKRKIEELIRIAQEELDKLKKDKEDVSKVEQILISLKKAKKLLEEDLK